MSSDNQSKIQIGRPSPMVGKIILAGAIVLILMIISFVVGAATGRFSRVAGLGYGHHRRTGAPRHGLFSAHNNNSQNRLFGTVTAVNGASFTVAGQGASTTVQTNSSTTYTNGNQVKVNDSVVVHGTKNGNTFTANWIAINP